MRMPRWLLIFALLGLLVAVSCQPRETEIQSQVDNVKAFIGARIIAHPTLEPIAQGVLLVRDGRVDAVGTKDQVTIPGGAEIVDLGNKVIIPGLISGHVHISDVNGMRAREYTDANTLRQLNLFARYGFTSVLSLGGEKEPAFRMRDEQEVASLNRARIYVSGDVITATTPEEARAEVTRIAQLRPDWIKFRVDDNLGSGKKMAPEVYKALIEEAHAKGLRVAAHIFYLEDAKAVLQAGADLIAHSVRDREIDQEFIDLMKERNTPYCPTLTREISTFIYESKPPFFDDPFFQREADQEVVAHLTDSKTQAQYRTSRTAAGYKAGLEVARKNLKKAADAGLLILMGTDSGPFPERFEGYFEHLEMEMMVEAGMSPKAVLISATSDAARVIRNEDIGTLKRRAWADFVVLDRDPLEDIRNTRSISEVRIAGNLVPPQPMDSVR
jgi:imidazolonepropionase-like amidohydrolase